MKRIMIISAALIVLAACNNRQVAEEYPTLTVSEFILQAEQLENTIVSVIGEVDHLCMGTRAKIHFICPDHTDESIKIFADDDIGEFSDTLVGKIVKVTGTVEVSTKIDHAYLDKWETELESDADYHDHGDEEGEEHHHHDSDVEEPETHHHGNQMALIAKYRKLVDASGKGYINLYKIIVSAIEPAELPGK